MKAPQVDLEPLTDGLVVRLLTDALQHMAVAFALANKTAVLFTIANIERDLTAQIDALAESLGSSDLIPIVRARVQAKVATVLSGVQREVENAWLQ